MKRIFIFVIFISIISQYGIGQEYRFLRSMEYERNILKSDTTLVRKNNLLEKQISEFGMNPEIKNYQLPIVFHVLYTDGIKAPDQAQIENQIKELNKHFKLKGYKSKHPAALKEKFEEKEADLQLDFCLATKDPSGRKSEGINFVKTFVKEFGLNNDMKAIEKGGVVPWDVDHYINVWVVNLADSVSGFAQMPGRNMLTDGIVIDYNFIGSKKELQPPYNEGKTLVHLLGNYLGLYDLWGPCECCDDNVADTPIHNSPNFGSNDKYKQISTCFGNPVEMTMNYMDNSDDEWMEMFTIGQKMRIQAALNFNGARSGITNTDLCNDKVNEDLVYERTTLMKLLEIFPNPAGNFAQLNFYNLNPAMITIMDGQGKMVFVQKTKGSSVNESIILEISDWQSGLYFVLMNDNEDTKKTSFVIQH